MPKFIILAYSQQIHNNYGKTRFQQVKANLLPEVVEGRRSRRSSKKIDDSLTHSLFCSLLALFKHWLPFLATVSADCYQDINYKRDAKCWKFKCTMKFIAKTYTYMFGCSFLYIFMSTAAIIPTNNVGKPHATIEEHK